MSVKVSLQSVVDKLDALMEGYVAYLNAKTGELISLSEDDRMLAEQEVDPEEEIPKWQQEALPKFETSLSPKTISKYLRSSTSMSTPSWRISVIPSTLQGCAASYSMRFEEAGLLADSTM